MTIESLAKFTSFGVPKFDRVVDGASCDRLVWEDRDTINVLFMSLDIKYELFDRWIIDHQLPISTATDDVAI